MSSAASIVPITSEKAGRPETIALLAVPFMPASASIGGAFLERFDPRAFDAQSRDWRSSNVRLLLQHEVPLLLATTVSGSLAVSSDRSGVRAVGALPRTMPYVAELVGRGDLAQVSIGFKARRDVWGIEDGIPTRMILEAQLFEISIVTSGTAAYPQTWCVTRSQARRRVNDLRSRLAEERAGKVLSAATREALHAAIAHLSGLLNTADAPDDDEQDIPAIGPTKPLNPLSAQDLADEMPGAPTLTNSAAKRRLVALDRAEMNRRLRDLRLNRRYPGGRP